MSIGYTTFNKVVKTNRLYKEVKKFSFSATGAELLNVDCGKDITVGVPGTTWEITIAGAHFKLSAGLKGDITIQRDKEIETNNISYSKSKVRGGGYVSPKLEATLLGVSGIIQVETGIRFIYPYKENMAAVGVEFYSTDTYGYLTISKDVSMFVTADFRYDLFRLDTSTKKEMTVFNINTLID